MGKKKHHPDAEEILSRPWCYYCERDFDDLKILISHQKAKHFKCDRCGRRLNTAGGLSVHMTQVHKETLTSVENALPNRAGLDVEIFGMEGIPDDVVTAHNQRVLSQFQQAEAERRAATGNLGPGASGSAGPKKPKFESPSDLKKRLAEHKAKLAAEQAAGGSSGGATPLGAGQPAQIQSPGPALGQSPGGFAGSPPYGQPVQPQYSAPNSATYSSFPQTYDQPSVPFQQTPAPYLQQQPGGFQSPGIPQYPQPPQFPPGPQFQQGAPSFSQPYQHPGRPPGAASPPVPMNYSQPPRIQTPPQNGSQPPRLGSLPPAAAGLPQRPSFGAPPVNAFQMQQMHHGQVRGPPAQPISGVANSNGNAASSGQQSDSGPNSGQDHVNAAFDPSALENATSLDDLVSGAAQAADKAESKAVEPVAEKKGKKDKERDRSTRLVYSDNDISPEEKMARLPRYAFEPPTKGETVLGDATTATVTGVSTGPDDVLDVQN
ncbi:MAG: hypothetical protein M1833_002233 [Piccolia ochrophora]|nr:MAG: hypothetical protein M1833_002233 [Piccolia ochrophora]